MSTAALKREYLTSLRTGAAEHSRARSLAGRDIGAIPEPADLARRESCRLDLRRFCETYLTGAFYMGWAAFHLTAFEKMQTAVLTGGLFALAMPRGSGKSALSNAAAEWATLYGHRRFVVMFGSEQGIADNMVASVKFDLEHNELIGEDFPEVCVPIRALEGIAQRARGQLSDGKRTAVVWGDGEVVFPRIEVPWASNAGSIIVSFGLTSSFRGLSRKSPDGSILRPDLVIADDPQTRESSRSASQCELRELLLKGDVLGLAGPKKKIAGFLPCTVIYPGDMADRILNRTKNPEWQGELSSMLTSMPANLPAWEKYREIAEHDMAAGKGKARATQYYLEHRAILDEGAVASWPERFDDDQASAIQNAMDLYFRNEEVFWAEYQNQPKIKNQQSSHLSADEICAKLNNHKRGLIPQWATHLTAFVDVQGEALYWGVCAWGDDMTGACIDYGCYPEQPSRYFSLSSIKVTLSETTGIASLQGRIYAGLKACTDMLFSQGYAKDDGTRIGLSVCLIDANWGESTDTVYQFSRQCGRGVAVVPSHGRFIGASSKALTDYQRKPGDRVGHYWRMPALGKRGAVRHVLFDANYWKSWLQSALGTPMAEPGCFSLYQSQRPDHHRMLADHLTAEYCVRVTRHASSREVDEWKARPDRKDNHLLDALVGCAVGAAMQGLVSRQWRRPGDTVKKTTAPRRLKYGAVGSL